MRITATYITNLQAIYHKIDQRGICVDLQKIEEAKKFIEEETQRLLQIASSQWNVPVFVGAARKIKNGININSTQGEHCLLTGLQNLGYKIPKITKKDSEGEYVSKESTSELALQKMLVTNQFNYPAGDNALRAILAIREMGKLNGTYFGCNLHRNQKGESLYLTNYNCTGTVTGRRSSRRHAFGYGNNAQNFPKHGQLAKMFRRTLRSRDNCIFLMVDQKGAELWPVYALADDKNALSELRAGVNRHIKRAAGVFQIPIDAKTEDEWKKSSEYYLGKKIGHALNYGMRGNRMSESLAQEGKSISPQICQQLLDRANKLEPNIDGVFHEYVKNEIYKTRTLKTPFGRERQFLGLRPNDGNYKIFNEAYSYIPQSTVGDNTGFAVSYLESNNTLAPSIIQESHDSIVQDIPADLDILWLYLQHTIQAFDRTISFHNGNEVNIPVEAEIGYNFADTIRIDEPLCFDNLKKAFEAIKY